MSDVDKNEIINKIYFDRSGFGSVQTTYQDAKKKEPSITLNDVKAFKKDIEQKKQLKGQNSFTPPYPNYEYQMDLFFINDLDLDNQKLEWVY